MNDKTLLMTILSLLYAESRLTDPETDHEVIRKALLNVRLPKYVDEDDERFALVEIKDIISNVVDGGVPYEHDTAMRRIKLATTQNAALYDSIKEFMVVDESNLSEEERLKNLKSVVSNAYFSVRQSLITQTLMQDAGKLMGVLKGTEGRVDLNRAVADLKTTLSTFSERSHNKIPSLVGELSTTNVKGLQSTFKSIGEKAEGNGLRTGWKGINQMLGCNGGITEELWLMPALPFNCKSLFSLLLSLSIPLFNSPEWVMRNVKGDLQPCILDLTFENEFDINLSYAYQQIYGHFENKKAELTPGKKATEAERDAHNLKMSEYLCSKMRQNGWEYFFQKHTNTDFKVHYLNDLIEMKRREGYHVVGIRGDYFGTINKAGHGNGIAGSDIKEIYRIARNIQVVRNKGFLLAPHQISPAGKAAKAVDPVGFCKSLPGRGLYDNCTSLDNEADGELYFNKREVDGMTFLEVQRGKHRTIIETPESKQYCVLPFQEPSILPWDVDRDHIVSANSINHFTGGMDNDLLF